MESVPLMEIKARRLLWFAFLKVKAHCTIDHRVKTMWAYFQTISLDVKLIMRSPRFKGL